MVTGGAARVPVWHGALYPETFRRPWHLVTIGVTNRSDTAGVRGLMELAAAAPRVEVAGGRANGIVTRVLPRGVPITGR